MRHGFVEPHERDQQTDDALGHVQERVRDGRDKGQRHQGKEIVQWVEENQFHAKILERGEKIAESVRSLDELIRRQTEQSQQRAKRHR